MKTALVLVGTAILILMLFVVGSARRSMISRRRDEQRLANSP